MKFGETLYDRSPRFPNQNLPYNELKRIIKQRTSEGSVASPVPIPGQSSHRWSLLEDDLFHTLKIEHDNIVLFLRSKIGEVERRITYLNKSVKSAKRWATTYSGRPTLLARKFQKLVYDAEQIGEDIQALSQYAAVQKLAFRKILKKYRKWTSSDGLQSRMENEVFSHGQLQIDLTQPMKDLSIQLARIADLEDAMLNKVGSTRPPQDSPKSSISRKIESPIGQISSAVNSGPLYFDSAIASVPFGEAAGLSAYWIHSDNLEEAKVLLLRYMRDIKPSLGLKRKSSSTSVTSEVSNSEADEIHVAYFDNIQRFLQDTSTCSPSNTALTARWSTSKGAVVDLSDMQPNSDSFTNITIRRKDLAPILDRTDLPQRSTSTKTENIQTVQSWLSQHRDVTPLAHMRSQRSRYAGITNSTEVGNFATLDVDVAFSRFHATDVLSPGFNHENYNNFPHAILQIRWEFGPRPEVVRAFDSTHLAEKVEGFTLESAAISNQHPQLSDPKWSVRLQEDIRKVPKVRGRRQESSGLTSAPSSTEGPSESIFSIPEGRSTGGSETSPMASVKDDTGSTIRSQSRKKRKKTRIDSQIQSPGHDQSARYYNEYDDPDSELYQAEAYAIYVNPNEDALGVETIRRFGAWLSSPFASLSNKSKVPEMAEPNERTPLFSSSIPRSGGEEDMSSESDSDQPAKPRSKGTKPQQHHPLERYRQRLNRRQRAHETTLGRFSIGLLILACAFSLMSGTLLTTGRKKEALEVNAGASTGVMISFICTFAAMILTFRRKQKLSMLERVTLTIAIGTNLLIGASIIIVIVHRAAVRR